MEGVHKVTSITAACSDTRRSCNGTLVGIWSGVFIALKHGGFCHSVNVVVKYAVQSSRQKECNVIQSFLSPALLYSSCDSAVERTTTETGSPVTADS